MKTIILSSDDIGLIVRTVGLHKVMDEMIDRLGTALRSYHPDRDIIPVRGGFHYQEPGPGLLEWMPSLCTGSHATIKIVGYHPHNPRLRNMPTILSTISAYDVATGHLIGVADATLLTALRTGAASAIASRLMASPTSTTVGLIGAGAQALTQLHALSRVFTIEHVFVYDMDPAVSARFRDRAGFLNLEIAAVPSEALAAMIAEADILCTATTVEVGRGPVLADGETRPWLHVNAVGSDFPGKVELPDSLVKRSVVCPDFLEQALREGECQQLSEAEVGPTLAQLVRNPDHYRHLQEQMTVFDSTGWALEDQVAMGMMMEYAAELNLGTPVQIESSSSDPRDPYSFCWYSASAGASSNGLLPTEAAPESALNLMPQNGNVLLG